MYIYLNTVYSSKYQSMNINMIKIYTFETIQFPNIVLYFANKI